MIHLVCPNCGEHLTVRVKDVIDALGDVECDYCSQYMQDTRLTGAWVVSRFLVSRGDVVSISGFAVEWALTDGSTGYTFASLAGGRETRILIPATELTTLAQRLADYYTQHPQERMMRGY